VENKQTYGRLDEEYIADFCLVSQRNLSPFENQVFRNFFLLGADWRLCCRQMKCDRGDFFHAVYRIQQRLGRVYRGLMVSMRASNAKLLRRAQIIVTEIVGCDENDAAKFVERAEGDVKIAILLALGWEQAEAVEALLKHEGNLRSVIDELAHDRA